MTFSNRIGCALGAFYDASDVREPMYKQNRLQVYGGPWHSLARKIETKNYSAMCYSLVHPLVKFPTITYSSHGVKVRLDNGKVAQAMSFQSKLDQPDYFECLNLDGEIDATQYKFPLKVLEEFIQYAPRGSKVVYFRGPFLNAFSIGEFARNLHVQGHCELVQRRIKGGRNSIFEYIIVKR